MTNSRLPFLIAVALIAAAAGDALVETIANSGAVGHGYADNNHLSVVPALVGGASLAAMLVWRRCVALLRHPAQHADWLVSADKEMSARSPFADVPFVLLLQFGALFVMESCEQLCFSSKLLGGTVWLGGPIWFSVLAHVLLGLSCTLLLRRAVHALVGRCAVLVVTVLALMLDAFDRSDASVFARRCDRSCFRHNQTLRVHQIGERAPPLLLALT